MEEYCVTFAKAGKESFEVLFSAWSLEDAKTRAKLQFPNAEIISVKERYNSVT